jgi:adenine phosphoribosyltransferase
VSTSGAAVSNEVADRLAMLIRDVPDFPKPGILFKDISPMLADHRGFTLAVEALAAPGRDSSGKSVVDKVVGIEARGFILAAPVALALGAGFVPVRKQGKLPAAAHSVRYALEYGEAILEVHRDALQAGEQVLVVDDVLATGGTVVAAAELVRRCGAEVRAVSVLMELRSLFDPAKLTHLDVHAVLTL